MSQKTPLIVTNSSLHMFMSCQQKYDYRYNKNIVPVKKSSSLLIGSAVHSGLEAWYKYGIKQHAIDSSFCEGIEANDLIKARAMIDAYTEQYNSDALDVSDVEMTFSVPMVSPETGRKRRGLFFSGKIDALVNDESNGLWIMEHKTTDSADETYQICKSFDDQTYLYAWAIEQLTGKVVRGAIYNIIVKPRITPSKGETEDEFNARLAEAKKPERCKRKMPETDSEFYERVKSNMTADKFVRFQFEIDEAEKRKKVMSLINTAKQIRNLTTPTQNTSACSLFGGCDYCKLCYCKGNHNKCAELYGDLFNLRAPHEELEVNHGTD